MTAEPEPGPEVPCAFCGAPAPMDLCGPLLWIETASAEARFGAVGHACHEKKKAPPDVQES